VLLQAKG
jgi:ribosomal protein L37E